MSGFLDHSKMRPASSTGRGGRIWIFVMLCLILPTRQVLAQPEKTSKTAQSYTSHTQSAWIDPSKWAFAGANIPEPKSNQGDPLVPLLYVGMEWPPDESSQKLTMVRFVQGQGSPSNVFEDGTEDGFPKDDEGEMPLDEGVGVISDPLEPINRVMFHFNDKLYFWLLKPLAIGYKAIAPEPVRISFRNFFYNLSFPVRFLNCVFQGKFEAAAEEMRRFSINTVCGLAGFLDIATKHQGIKKYEEDLGQTFGSYGIGPGFFIMWPILGPSNMRDTVGFFADRFAYPVSYIIDPSVTTFALNAFDIVNGTSLRIGEYEDLKEASFDPYIALRDAYYQNRRAKIED